MNQGQTIITKSFEETQQLGMDFAKTLKPGDVVCLHGDLGSGKTTFVQGVAKGLGNTKQIISPTFIIMRTYKNMYHIDLYRIENENDINGIGLLDLIKEQDRVILIEWPEKIEHLLPTKRKNLFFEYVDDKRRTIVIE